MHRAAKPALVHGAQACRHDMAAQMLPCWFMPCGSSPRRSQHAGQLQTLASARLQVRHAQQAGAAAAIVYDNAYEPLIIMSKPAGHASPGIPAVFISQKSGIIMKKLMTPGVTIAHIMPVRPCSLFWSPESKLHACIWTMPVHVAPYIACDATIAPGSCQPGKRLRLHDVWDCASRHA